MACPNDETLFALIEGQLRGEALAEVDSHLDECALCRDAVAALASGPRVKAPEDAPAVIGRFVLLQKIGEGAMGVVWSAYDPELDRKVALKLLRGEGDSAKGRARLVREAQAMAQLSHPNVVTVYDVGAHADGVYVAMELIEGQSLRAWLAQRRRSRDAILAIFAQAGAGLAAAHDAGLVHRDFKPENVLVDAQGRAKVGDFGLARAEETERAELPEGALLTASLTRTGALLGTPAYMAPEQLAGEPAGPRSDQFAFAVALFEALEGQRPFASASTAAALREAIAKGPPPARAAGRAIEAALRRGLAPRAEDRFEDLRGLLAAITRRPRPVAWIAAGAALVLAAGGALYGFRPAPLCEASRSALGTSWPASGVTPVAAPSLDRFARAWTAARVDACEDTHVRHEQSAPRMDARMACLDRQRGALEAVIARLRDDDAALVAAEALAALPDPAACAADVEAPPPSAREAVAALRRRVDEGRVRVATADHAGALALADRLLPEAITLAYGPALAEAHLLRADALRGLARYEDARESAREGLLAAEAAGDGRAVVTAWLAIVRTEGAAGRFADAVLPLRHAEAALVRAGSPPDLRETLLRLRGVVRTSLGELDRAEEDLRAALAPARERGGGLELAPIHTSLGELARLDGRLDDALREHQRALALDREALGPAHPRTGRDLHNVAGILRRLGRTADARARYLEALAIATEALSAEHPDVALTQNSLGLLAFEAGDRGEARERWDAARAIFEARDHGDAALVHHNLALLELEERRFDAARGHAERAIAIDEARLGPEAKRVGGEHVALGRALAGLGRPSEARAALERARAIAAALGDPPLAAEAQRELDRLVEPAPIARARPAVRATPEVAPPIAPEPPPPPPSPPIVQRRTGSGAYGAGAAWE